MYAILYTRQDIIYKKLELIARLKYLIHLYFANEQSEYQKILRESRNILPDNQKIIALFDSLAALN